MSFFSAKVLIPVLLPAEYKSKGVNVGSEIPVIVYPNRGGQWDSAAGVWIGQTPRSLAQWLPDWTAAGVAIVGGCCGTSATDIAELSQA